MTTREEAIRLCMELPGVYEDYPFDDGNWTVMRHGSNKKMFAAIYHHQGCMWMNVKAEPSWGDFWRSSFEAVVPAYHMNKLHWVSIILDGSMSDEEIRRLVHDSYRLTAPRKTSGGRSVQDKESRK